MIKAKICTIISILLCCFIAAIIANLPKWIADAKANTESAITLRGRALLIAIDTGLVKENERDNYEIGAFIEFYDRFMQLVDEDCLKKRK